MRSFIIPGLRNPVSQLILGTDYYKPEILEQIVPLIDEFVALGGNTIDTARVYGGGQSEKAIGMWLQGRKDRDQLNIWTKGAHHDSKGPRVTPEAIYDDMMFSLEQLQLDQVDMYALHRDNPDVPVGPIIEALNEHLEAGRILAFGGSNWSWQRLQEANDYASAHGLVGFTFSSPNLSLAKAKEAFWQGCISVDDETAAWHTKSQLPVLSWSSQARGFFTGRFSRDNFENKDLVRVFYNDENWARYDRAEAMGKENGMSTIEIALAYVLNQSYPTGALIGPANLSEMRSCFSATQMKFTPEQIAWLEG